MPANNIFDGPITNLLSVLCVLVEVLSRAHAKRGRCSKHGSEGVKTKTELDIALFPVLPCLSETSCLVKLDTFRQPLHLKLL